MGFGLSSQPQSWQTGNSSISGKGPLLTKLVQEYCSCACPSHHLKCGKLGSYKVTQMAPQRIII